MRACLPLPGIHGPAAAPFCHADLQPDTLQHLEELARCVDEHGEPLIPCASNVQEEWGLKRLLAGGRRPAQLSHQSASGAARCLCVLS